MPVDVIVLAAAAVVAVIALTAAVVTVRSARQSARDRAAVAELLKRAEEERDLTPAPFEAHTFAPQGVTSADLVLDARPLAELSPAHVVDGKVIVVPTQQQLVATVLSRPTTRLAVWATGLAYALRAESRDRIAALMRREFTRRRRERQRAARRAARAPLPTVPRSAIPRAIAEADR
ncbi:MAG: hypothetical protein QM597_05830 [Aeromicrobium sp.]|uniref:hypothetical protein n=1 Tax=Aeromicrobium sp. TaxID=1871063 RepID=UPI0039E5F855